MAAKPRGLGRGLDALIPETSGPKKKSGQDSQENALGGNTKDTAGQKEASAKGPETIVKITKVEPNREQPRKHFEEDALQELADSIKQYGLLQPILVQDKQTYYEIIAGERRWRAAKLAGLKEIPVIIKNYTPLEIVEISLIENIQRQDLNPIEEALAYKRLLTEFNLKQEEVAERVSKSRAAVTNALRLLKLSPNVQQMLTDEMISMGHARALLAIEDPELQYTVAQKVFDEKLSVRDVERLMKKAENPEKEPKTAKKEENPALAIIYGNIEEDLKKKLSTKVAISAKGNGAGKIEISFFSHEDLERLLELI